MSESLPPPPESKPDPLIGRAIDGKYKVVSLLARGGMGKVYRAEQMPLGRTCALKVLNPAYAGDSDPEFHKRFFLEASIASKLTHPNTVTIFDYGHTDDGVYFMAMELLEGRTLYRALREDGPFDDERAANVARQVCRSLREAHAHGVIHRDLKPANIFLSQHGDERDLVKVLDFGLVKAVDAPTEELTQAGLFMGSPKYMSPEQIRGDRVDARTDIYSLGIVLYEAVTGKVPFDRQNSVNTLMAHVTEAPRPLRETNPDCKTGRVLEAAIFRCLAKEPADRFESMGHLLLALKLVSPGMAINATAEYPHAGAPPSGSFAAAETGFTGVTSPSLSPPVLGSQSGPLPGVGSATATARLAREGRPPLLAVGVTAVVTALAAAAFAFARTVPRPELVVGERPSSAERPAPTPRDDTPPSRVAATTFDADASAEPPPGAAPIVHVDTEPAGATVRLHGREGEIACRATPCDVTLPAGGEGSLYVARKGYVAETKTIDAGTRELVIRLVALPATSPRSTAPLEGFKPAPY